MTTKVPTNLAVPPDPWASLRQHTPARIALGASGDSLPTEALLRFGVDHAQARDAVHRPLDVPSLLRELAERGFDDVIELESAAPDRSTYVRRPDLGRQLSSRSEQVLQALHRDTCDVLCVLGDGLSATAVQRHAPALLVELRAGLAAAGLSMGPIVVTQQARVALGDPIAHALKARSVLMLIGERPGMSSPDSLGAYLTWAPRPGVTDAQRNCVSNIRPAGLRYGEAAFKIVWLLTAARQLGASGVELKDESVCPPQFSASVASSSKVSLGPIE